MRSTAMSRKAKAPAAAALLFAPLTPSWTLQERVRGIGDMAERIAGYVRFMSDICTLNGVSAELKERAVTACYEQLVLVENQLGHIQDQRPLE